MCCFCHILFRKNHGRLTSLTSRGGPAHQWSMGTKSIQLRACGQNVGKHWRYLLWIAPYLDSWHEAYQADFEGSLILIVTFINTAWSDFIQAEFNLNINLPTKFWFYVPKDFKWKDFQNFVTCNLLISQDMKSTLTITNHQLAAHSWKSVELAQRGFNPHKIT